MGAKLSLVLALAAGTLAAHHSFEAEFDINKPLELHGTVIQMEWVNPHTWIHVSIKNPDGSETRWSVEGNTPNSLLRAGFTKNSLAPGTEVVIRGFQSRTGDNKISGSTLQFKDGRTMSVGSNENNKALLEWVSSDEQIWRKLKADQIKGVQK